MMRWEPNSLTDSGHPIRGLSRGIGSEDQRRFLEAQSFSKRVEMLKHFCVETLLEIISDILIEEFGACHKKTLPKALRIQVLTALTSNFGLVGLVCLVW